MEVLRELLARAVLALVGLPILIVCAYWGGWPLLILVAVITVIGLGEYYSATLMTNICPAVLVGYLGALALLTVTAFSTPKQCDLGVLVVLAAVAATAMLSQVKGNSYAGATVNSATTVFGVVYVGLLMSFLLRLADLDLPAALGEPGSLFAASVGALLLVAIPVWCLDTFAFIVGSAWGRHQLSPQLSPRKTIEGALAGFIGCVGLTVLLGWWLKLPMAYGLALGILLAVVAQLGDAAKSTIKRDLGIDDFGNIFGPHGGILDRFDGLLFAMPAAWLYLTTLLGS